MNNAEYRAFNNYAQELSKLQIENAMLKKELEDVKSEIYKVCTEKSIAGLVDAEMIIEIIGE